MVKETTTKNRGNAANVQKQAQEMQKAAAESAKSELSKLKQDGVRSVGDLKKYRSTYTEELGVEILARVMQGQSLRAICALDHMPSLWCLSQWLYSDMAGDTEHQIKVLEFRQAYTHARRISNECMGDELIEIADSARDYKDAPAKKLQLTARQFLLERRLPREYAPVVRTLEDEADDQFVDKLERGLAMIVERREARMKGLPPVDEG